MRIKVITTSLSTEEENLPKSHWFEGEEVIIGRSPHSDLCIEDPTLSAMHAKIFLSTDPQNRDKRILFLKDLGSSNGTSLENTQLQPFCEVPLDGTRWVRLGMSIVKAVLEESNETVEAVQQIADVFNETAAPMPIEPTLELPSNFAETIMLQEEVAENAAQSDFARPVSSLGLAPSSAESHFMEALLDDEPTQEIKPLPPQAVYQPAEISVVSEEAVVTDQIRLASGKVVEDDILDLDFEAQRMVTIGGAVVHHGRPLSGVELDGGPLGVVTSDFNGRFSFDSVPEGTAYEITASMNDLEFVTDRLAGVATDSVELEFTTLITFTLGGRVVYRGEPVADAEVDGGPLGKAWTDKDGWYQFSNLPANTEFELKVSKKGYEFKRRTVKLAA